MTNTNIQGVIPLIGRGLVHKPSGNYEPGEFKKLQNVEIVEGVLRTRRSISSLWSFTDYTNSWGFVGTYPGRAVIVSDASLDKVSDGEGTEVWDNPALLAVPAGANSYHKIIYSYEYNNTAATPQLVTLWHDGATWAIKSITGGLAAPVTTTLLTFTKEPIFRNAFIFKERLWLVLDDKVYFSKATDPKVFAVPNGGFIGIDDVIEHATALNDSVFILARSGVHVMSFTSDPNEDGSTRPISRQGGVHSVVHQGNVFLTDGFNLYTIQNNSVALVAKLEDVVPIIETDYTKVKLVSFDDSIFIFKVRPYRKKSVYNFDINFNNEITNPPETYKVLVFNTDSNSFYDLVFEDSTDLATVTDRGTITDARVCKATTGEDDTLLFLVTRKVGVDYKSRVYSMDARRKYGHLQASSVDSQRSDGMDKVLYSAGASTGKKIVQRIEIESFSPDGNKYLMKKFRHLMGEAKLPVGDFRVLVSVDEAATSLTQINSVGITTALVDSRSPYPFRVGINKRGRSLNLLFETFNTGTNHAVVGNVIADTHFLELSDLRLLWSHTGRVPTTKDDGK